MAGDADGREPRSRGRRPGRAVLLATAALLLLGGGTAVALGVAGQDADPTMPAATGTTGSSGGGPSSGSVPDGTAPGSSTGSATPVPGTTVPSAATPATTVGAWPVSVSIAAIGVQSPLIPLGLEADGTLAVPDPGPDYDKAAWFDGSPRPGDAGPAVIEGHVDSAANGPSVFYSLGELAPGDRVEITRADGTVVGFEVYEVRVVPKNDFPTLDVYGNTAGPELRLITCGGPFDSSVRSYVDNVVVFARLAT